VTTDSTQQWYRFEEYCGAAVRALSGQSDAYYRGSRLYRGHDYLAVHAPHLQVPSPEENQLNKDDYRGIADGVAMRLIFCDEKIHRSNSPKSGMQRLVFELLEQLRVESLASSRWQGAKRNMHKRFTNWSLTCHREGLTESSTGLMFYTLAQMCWSRLNSCPVVEETEDFIEPTRAGIAPVMGSWIATLRKTVNDQQSYAKASIEIALEFDAMVAAARPDARDEENDLEEVDDEEEQLAEKLKLLVQFEDGDDSNIHAGFAGDAKNFDPASVGYQVFTTEYDREVLASDLVRPELLTELRERLDTKIRAQRININRISRQLERLLTAPELEGWAFNQEQGYIDARLLSRVVTSPHERKLFRMQDHHPIVNTTVSFLLDCSGSMKVHSESMAMFLDVMSGALNQINVATEILGFTTSGWNGGKAMTDWMAKGRPQNPGRLNGVNHMIYKAANTPWRQARKNIAALLKADTFREGIDGEAVQWAASRMLQRAEPRKILIVISDGCPMDTATNLANSEHYLDHHLQKVVAQIEDEGEIELYGLGVGLDLSPFYRRCAAIENSNIASHSTFSLLVDLIAASSGRKSSRSTVLFNQSYTENIDIS